MSAPLTMSIVREVLQRSPRSLTVAEVARRYQRASGTRQAGAVREVHQALDELVLAGCAEYLEGDGHERRYRALETESGEGGE